jgi:hypothetical protein
MIDPPTITRDRHSYGATVVCRAGKLRYLPNAYTIPLAGLLIPTPADKQM